MKIKELANLTGLSIPTLRYYEDLGLLKPQRLANNYREFSEADLNWLAFIQRGKAAGMSLAMIQQYSDLREQGDSTIPERIALLDKQTEILQTKKRELEAHVEFLEDKKQIYREMLCKRNSDMLQ